MAPEARGANKLVHTTLVKANGEKVPLNYLMHDTPAGWKATDVYLNGTISELATRRSEFPRNDSGRPAPRRCTARPGCNNWATP